MKIPEVFAVNAFVLFFVFLCLLPKTEKIYNLNGVYKFIIKIESEK